MMKKRRGSMTYRSLRMIALMLFSTHLVYTSALSAASSYEFTAYRMQHYSLHQEKHGCQGAMVVAEARSPDDLSLTRRCVIMKLSELTIERFLESKRQNAAAVLILIPQNISTVPEDVIQGFMVTESEVLKMETFMPVYVVPEDEQLLYMYAEVKHAAATKSASILIRVLRSMVTTTAFQILVNNNSPIKAIPDNSIITLEGVLPGVGEDPPTIVITAHYDSFGLAPDNGLFHSEDSLLSLRGSYAQVWVTSNDPRHEGWTHARHTENSSLGTNLAVAPVAKLPMYSTQNDVFWHTDLQCLNVFQWLSYGADSNASGVTMLLELARLFQRLYSDTRNKAQFHLLFSLTGGGKYNFIGTKHWLAENMDHAESSLLHDNVAFVLCLDSLGSGDELFLHVSRRPKPETPQFNFIQQLQEVISSRFPWVKFGTVHKKINLQESTLAWEHERYGMRHIPGFTLSHLQDSRSERRGSILDTISQVDIRKLKRNTVIVAEALVRYMYNLSDKGSPKELQVFKGSLDVLDSRLSALMTMLTSVPRATQLMDTEPQHTLLISSLEQEFRRHLQQVYRHNFHQDHRDPDITFFDQMKQKMMMYRVKPAAFDLFLGGCIAGYLGLVFYAIQNFGNFYARLKAIVKNKQQ